MATKDSRDIQKTQYLSFYRSATKQAIADLDKLSVAAYAAKYFPYLKKSSAEGKVRRLKSGKSIVNAVSGRIDWYKIQKTTRTARNFRIENGDPRLYIGSPHFSFTEKENESSFALSEINNINADFKKLVPKLLKRYKKTRLFRLLIILKYRIRVTDKIDKKIVIVDEDREFDAQYLFTNILGMDKLFLDIERRIKELIAIALKNPSYIRITILSPAFAQIKAIKK